MLVEQVVTIAPGDTTPPMRPGGRLRSVERDASTDSDDHAVRLCCV